MQHTVEEVRNLLEKGKNVSLTELQAGAQPVETVVVLIDPKLYSEEQIKNEFIRFLRNSSTQENVLFSNNLSIIALNDQDNDLKTIIFPSSEIYTAHISLQPAFELADHHVVPIWDVEDESSADTEESQEEYIDKKEKSEMNHQEGVEVHLEEIEHQEDEESQDELNENQEREEDDLELEEDNLEDQEENEEDLEEDEEELEEEDLEEDEEENEDDDSEDDDEDDDENEENDVLEDEDEEESKEEFEENEEEVLDDEDEQANVLVNEEESEDDDDDEDLDEEFEDSSEEDDESAIENDQVNSDVEAGNTKETNKKIEQILKVSQSEACCFFKSKEVKQVVKEVAVVERPGVCAA